MQKGILAALLALGLFLRWQQISLPLWIDEAIFANLSRADSPEWRELIPLAIAKLTQPETPEALRWPFVLFSTSTILAAYLAIKDKRKALIVAAMFALAPIFVYWGAMARPYCVALFFVVLAWRWPVFYIPALITTPYALAGLNLWRIRQRWIFYAVIFFSGYVYYSSMELSNLDHFNIGFLLNAKRLWLIPIGALLLHCADADLEQLRGIFKHKK